MRRPTRRAGRALLRVSLVVLVSMATAAVAPTRVLAADGESEEQQLLGLINTERSSAGLAPLISYLDLVDDARAQASRMAEAGELFHNPDLAGVTSGWYALGENVGYAGSAEGLHEMFMGSPSHAANVLAEAWDYVGVGAALAEGSVWVSVVFMDGPAGLADYSGAFFDDEGSTHEDSIDRLAEAGVTQGCAPAMFCPGDPVTRAEMASFLTRALGLEASGADHFSDDEGSTHEDAINAVADAGVTNGCDTGRYCPEDPVTRAEMAAFLARALHLAASATDHFADDDGSLHEPSIDAVAAAGITNGCSAGKYCPTQLVTRAEMASFLVRALFP